MKIIAITQRTESNIEIQETRDALDQRWHDLLSSCDIIPLIIPNHFPAAKNLIHHFPFQGLLLTGGNDSPSRSEVEHLLLDMAIEKKLPVLGICHGMQVIQQYFGIKLQKIPGHVVARQNILINDKSVEVNSYHDFGTLETNNNLIVWARAYDGIIKAVRHGVLPITGIMWHPERMLPFKKDDISLIKNIFHGALECAQFY